jgi:hypothetical protein
VSPAPLNSCLGTKLHPAGRTRRPARRAQPGRRALRLRLPRRCARALLGLGADRTGPDRLRGPGPPQRHHARLRDHGPDRRLPRCPGHRRRARPHRRRGADHGEAHAARGCRAPQRRAATPAANGPFRARADARCASAARQLAALPPFPFANFDPLHPDPQLLPQVGRFFTGPHDPRPTLDALDAQLRALGQPPADRPGWGRVLAARAASRMTNDEQDQAALAADVPAFVNSLRDANATFRAVAISATVFGVDRCVL